MKRRDRKGWKRWILRDLSMDRKVMKKMDRKG